MTAQYKVRLWSFIFLIAVFEISWIVDLNVCSFLCAREPPDLPAVSCVSEQAAVCVRESEVCCLSSIGSTVLVAVKCVALL